MNIFGTKKFVIHHSVSTRDTTTPEHIDRIGRESGYPEGSMGYATPYHYIIEGDGSLTQTRKEDEWVKHCQDDDNNDNSVAVCLTGNFELKSYQTEEQHTKRWGPPHPSEEQIKSLWYVVLPEFNKFEGHGQLPNEATLCPGKNLQAIIEDKKKEIEYRRKKFQAIFKQIMNIIKNLI